MNNNKKKNPNVFLNDLKRRYDDNTEFAKEFTTKPHKDKSLFDKEKLDFKK